MLTRRRTALHVLAGVLVTLLAWPLAMPSSADADCPDKEVLCSKLPASYPSTYKWTIPKVGACSDDWATCKISNCTNWDANIVSQCRALTREQHGVAHFHDHNDPRELSY
jgi:hypothetical protein